MRKLIYFLPLLLFNNLHADETTSGRIGLLKPTTGFEDTSFSWSSKTNRNWDISAATFTDNINRLDALAVDTTTLNSQFSTFSIDTGTIVERLDNLDASTDTITTDVNTNTTNIATNVTRLDNVATDTTTNAGNITTNSNNITTNSSRLDAVASDTTTNAGNITTNVNDIATNSSRLDAVATDTTTLSTAHISSAAETVDAFLLSNTGVSAGSCSNCDLTIDAQGRITVQADGSGGGGGAAAGGSSITLRQYDVYVGTLGANPFEVDIASNNEDGLFAALARIQALGLTDSTTAQGTIFYRAGVYTMTGATIPAGVTVAAVENSSTIWVMDSISETMVTIFGQGGDFSNLKNITFDLGKLAFRSEVIVYKQGARATDIVVRNADNQASISNVFNCVFCINDTSDVVIVADVQQFKAIITNIGTRQAPFRIEDSSDVWLQIRTGQGVDNFDNRQTFFLKNNRNVHIHDSIFTDVGGYFIEINSGNRDLYIERNHFNITKAKFGGTGIIIFIGDLAGADTSTATYITNNSFRDQSGDADSIIGILQSTTIPEGVVISGNIAKGIGVTPTFITISANVFGTLCTDNKVSNIVFISDGGVETNCTGDDTGNFREQNVE